MDRCRWRTDVVVVRRGPFRRAGTRDRSREGLGGSTHRAWPAPFEVAQAHSAPASLRSGADRGSTRAGGTHPVAAVTWLARRVPGRRPRRRACRPGPGRGRAPARRPPPSRPAPGRPLPGRSTISSQRAHAVQDRPDERPDLVEQDGGPGAHVEQDRRLAVEVTDHPVGRGRPRRSSSQLVRGRPDARRPAVAGVSRRRSPSAAPGTWSVSGTHQEPPDQPFATGHGADRPAVGPDEHRRRRGAGAQPGPDRPVLVDQHGQVRHLLVRRRVGLAGAGGQHGTRSAGPTGPGPSARRPAGAACSCPHPGLSGHQQQRATGSEQPGQARLAPGHGRQPELRHDRLQDRLAGVELRLGPPPAGAAGRPAPPALPRR